MLHAYSELYLECARSVMAHMFDYAVHGLGYKMNTFFEAFLVSPVCDKFERGDAFTIAGKSGIELALEVAQLNECPIEPEEVMMSMHRTPEFWLGWSLAYYQWYRGCRFSEILQWMSVQDMLQMYDKYHEMDIMAFVERVDEISHEAGTETRLKRYRSLFGLSQRELAERTGIPVRTIQQYEQRQKNINKAQVEYVIRLSKTLHCSVEDLMERYIDWH